MQAKYTTGRVKTPGRFDLEGLRVFTLPVVHFAHIIDFHSSII